MIEEAAQLWAAGDREKAFEVLCCVWAEAQDLELGELCEQISEVLVRERTHVGELSLAEQHAALMVAAKAGDRVAVHALLPWLTSVVRPKARQQIAFLAKPDPVLLRSLTVWLQRRPELNQVARYLADHRSRWLDRMHLWLLRDTPRERDRYNREIRTTMLDLREAPLGRALSEAEKQTLTELRRTFAAEQPADRRQADALLEAVREHPDDDVRRALLADFLLSRDEHDPRGEFINLQLRAAAGPLPEAARARERELLDLHGFRWLGPLVDQCYEPEVRFARGFLIAVALRPYSRQSEQEFGAPGHPIWATVEMLEGCSRAMIRHPVMRSLRSLDCDLDCAEELLRGPARPKIEVLSIALKRSPSRNPQGHMLNHSTVLALARGLLAKLDGVPNLRHLRLRDDIAADPAAWCWIWQGPRARLESLRLRIADQQLRLSSWAQQLRDDGARVELSLGYGMLCFTLRPADEYWTVRVSEGETYFRVADENLLRWITDPIAPALRSGGLRRIEIAKMIIDAERLGAALRKLGFAEGAIEVVAA